MATTPVYPSITGPEGIHKTLVPADGTELVDLYDNSQGVAAVKVDALVITTDNSADRVAQFYINDQSGSHLLGSRTIPDLSGTNGNTDPRVDILATLGSPGSDGVPVIWLPVGTVLQVKLDAALATGKHLYVVGRVITYT